MGTGLATLRHNRAEILRIARRHRVTKLSVFGSVARGDDGADSDVDFLAEFEAGASLTQLIQFEDELESLLNRRVDVVSVGGLKARDHHLLLEALPL